MDIQHFSNDQNLNFVFYLIVNKITDPEAARN